MICQSFFPTLNFTLGEENISTNSNQQYLLFSIEILIYDFYNLENTKPSFVLRLRSFVPSFYRDVNTLTAKHFGNLNCLENAVQHLPNDESHSSYPNIRLIKYFQDFLSFLCVCLSFESTKSLS
jgi:hypothetical protein